MLLLFIFCLSSSCGHHSRKDQSTISEVESSAPMTEDDLLRLGERNSEKYNDIKDNSNSTFRNNAEKSVYSLQASNNRTLDPSDKTSAFINKTQDYGLENISAIHLYAVDFDGDKRTDLVVLPDYFSIPDWYRFDGKKFQKLAYNPMPEVVRGSYLAFYDFNQDGLKDLLVGTLNQKSAMRAIPWRIFINYSQNGVVKFIEEKDVFPVADSSSGVSFLDFNGDGVIDLFQPNWFSIDGKLTNRPDQLFLGEQTKLFNETKAYFKSATAELFDELKYSKTERKFLNATPSFGSSICDVDRNGRPDILTTSSNGYSNKLWMRETNLEKEYSFKDYGEETGYAFDETGDKLLRGGGNSFFSLCMDYNNDGIADIMLGSLNRETDDETRDRSSILTGSKLTFPFKFIRTDFFRESQNEKFVEGDRRGVILDYNNDGLIDFIVDNSGFPPHSRLMFFKQETDHAFVDISKNEGLDLVNPSGTVSIDLNNDGRMDFITAQTALRAGQYLDSKTKIHAFENRVKNKNKSIRIYLKGSDSNHDGISASIEVVTNKRKMWRMVEYVYGGLPSQNEEGIHFGLGTDLVKTINVNWPFFDEGRPRKITYKIDPKKISKAYTKLILNESGKVEFQ